MPASAAIRARFRMVSVRPSIIPSMIEHAEKWSIRNIRKESSAHQHQHLARVYLRLRFAAQAVLKARRNGQRKSIISGKVEDLPWRSALQRLDLRQRVPSIRPQKWVCT